MTSCETLSPLRSTKRLAEVCDEGGGRGRRLAWKQDVKSLDPDGCLVRRPHGRHHTQENRDASAATRREWSRSGGTQRKKSSQKLRKGGVLPLDKSLLMGAFPKRRRCTI